VIRALIFDLDGLLVDTETPEFETWRSIFAEHGVTLSMDAWSVCIGTQDAFDVYEHLSVLTGAEVDRDVMRSEFRRRLERAKRDLAPLPGASALIERAAFGGLGLAVASSSTLEWVEGHLTQVGLRSAFSCLSCYGHGVRAKPAPDTYLGALRALGVSASEAIAFEDSPNGIAGAKAAGLYCVAVPNGMTRSLSMTGADVVLPSLEAFELL